MINNTKVTISTIRSDAEPHRQIEVGENQWNADSMGALAAGAAQFTVG